MLLLLLVIALHLVDAALVPILLICSLSRLLDASSFMVGMVSVDAGRMGQTSVACCGCWVLYCKSKRAIKRQKVKHGRPQKTEVKRGGPGLYQIM